MADRRGRVMLVDDHAVVRAGYRMLLEIQNGYSVVSEVETAEAAIAAYLKTQPQVVIMDINLPGCSGIEATRKIMALDPQAKILIFSIHAEAIYLSRAFEAGASGYLCKSSSPGQMIEAVDSIMRHGHYRDPNVPLVGARGFETIQDPIRLLSAREFEIFQLLGRGLASREISEALAVSPKTISNSLVIIKEKLALGSTAELVKIASRLAEEPSGRGSGILP
jgi:two-component system, NarL family, invasion response regulator UvrY